MNPFIGFNAGNTTRAYEFFPYSQQPRVSQLIEGGDEKMKGRYLFQVDEEIYTGTCIDWGKRTTFNAFFKDKVSLLTDEPPIRSGKCIHENSRSG